MPQCPKCGAKVEKPTKVWSVLGEPDKSGSMLEQKVGIYECQKCHARFPYSLSSQRLAIVKVESLQKLHSVVMSARDTVSKLQEKMKEMEEEKAKLQAMVKGLEERATINELQARADALEMEIMLLRERKRGLEEEVTRYKASMGQWQEA